MTGRVKRKAGLAAAAALAERASAAPTCVLCGRPLGARVEWHHLVPKSEGGRITAPVHPICHRTIHATLANGDLARVYADPAALRAHPDIARFLRWIAGKDPDFHCAGAARPVATWIGTWGYGSFAIRSLRCRR